MRGERDRRHGWRRLARGGHTQRRDTYRLISARKATREETDAYFENAGGP